MSILLNGIVVANSRKNGGYCLVIYETNRKCFYRIVSDSIDRIDGELISLECCSDTGTMIDLLDEIKIYVKSLNIINDKYQKENLVLDSSKKIEILRRVDKNELVELYGLDKLNIEREIFMNVWASMSISEAVSCSKAFILVRVFSLRFYETLSRSGEPICKCSFKYNGIEYRDISVTISRTKEEDLRKYAGRSYPNGIVGFSFGHPYEDKCFKYLCSFLGVLPFKRY